MPNQNTPPISPLSVRALHQVNEVESVVRKKLSNCWMGGRFDYQKALRVLSTYIGVSIDVQIDDHRSHPDFCADWQISIAAETVERFVEFFDIQFKGVDGQRFKTPLRALALEHLRSKIRASKSAARNASLRTPGNPNESISARLQELRHDCRMTVQEIAEEIDLTPRSVSRHLSGEAVPRLSHLAAYESLFSKKTHRTIRF